MDFSLSVIHYPLSVSVISYQLLPGVRFAEEGDLDVLSWSWQGAKFLSTGWFDDRLDQSSLIQSQEVGFGCDRF
jgi:hypothetical protein